MDGLIVYFFITFFISTLFAMGGIGGAIALVSIFPMMGLNLNVTKALALFVNTASMISSSVMNFKRGVLDFKFALPIIISIMIATPIGAVLAQDINVKILNILLICFLFVSATLLFFNKTKPHLKYRKKWLLFVIGFSVGMISGMLGVGGGSLIMPLLILLGYDAKKSAYAVSFVIPFSTLAAFLTYLQFTSLDVKLLLTVTVAAILGGYLGGRIMHFKLNQIQIKKLLAVILYLLAFKIATSL